jgi:hypothetical protein
VFLPQYRYLVDCLVVKAQAFHKQTLFAAIALLDKSRKEHSAEHSWHLAMYVLLLGD